MLRIKSFFGLVLLLLGGVAPAQADAVVDWNEITVQAASVGRPGPDRHRRHRARAGCGARCSAGARWQFEPYHAEIDAARGDRVKGHRSAAIAAAAHDVLVAIYPAQAATLDATYFSYLADHGLDGDPGILVGKQVAARIVPLRRVNPNPLPPAFVGGTDPGVWRPTPSLLGNPPAPAPFSAMATPWMAGFDPFTLTSPTRFRAPPAPALTSDRYTRDYNEVRELGSLTSTKRTAEQTDLAYFYVETAPVLWNRALRGIATRYLRKSSDTARLFALANLATADALITCWDSKTHYAVWRPITAIREGDADGNPATVGEPAWQPLINNPNYPDYTSGANVVTGAMTRTLELFFGTDKLAFDVTTAAPQAVQKVRRYYRFSDAARDVVDARMLLGIHFRFADTAARTQGRQVADWTYNHFLLPLGGRDHHGHDQW